MRKVQYAILRDVGADNEFGSIWYQMSLVLYSWSNLMYVWNVYTILISNS